MTEKMEIENTRLLLLRMRVRRLGERCKFSINRCRRIKSSGIDAPLLLIANREIYSSPIFTTELPLVRASSSCLRNHLFPPHLANYI